MDRQDDRAEALTVQVIAFATPPDEDWRWRIVNYAGEVVDESYATFPTIRGAVAEGTLQLRKMDTVDTSIRDNPYRPTRSPRR